MWRNYLSILKLQRLYSFLQGCAISCGKSWGTTWHDSEYWYLPGSWWVWWYTFIIGKIFCYIIYICIYIYKQLIDLDLNLLRDQGSCLTTTMWLLIITMDTDTNENICIINTHYIYIHILDKICIAVIISQGGHVNVSVGTYISYLKPDPNDEVRFKRRHIICRVLLYISCCDFCKLV